LQWDDPVANLRDEIAKPIPPNDSLLSGHWVGDSTYTLRDTKALSLGDRPLNLWLFRDGRFRITDSTQAAFPKLWRGTYSRANDSLFLQPDAGSSGESRLFIVKLTFLGNYLGLYQPAELRYTHWHLRSQLKPDTLLPFLERGIWTCVLRRDAADSQTPETLRSRFEYLYFNPEGYRREWWNRGIKREETGPLSREGDTLWLGGGENQGYVWELLAPDTLRLWPLSNARLDSGFSLYHRMDSLPRYHLDLNGLPGYWRGDSARDSLGLQAMNYERFIDLRFGKEGTLTAFRQGSRVPAFTSWDIDSGRVLLQGSGQPAYRMAPKITTQGGDTLLTLFADPSRENPNPLKLYGTRRDGETLAVNPIARFPSQNHASLRIGSDTLLFLSHAAWMNGKPEQAEFAAIPSPDTAWLILTLPAQASFSSDETGFRLKIQARTDDLGRFTCQAAADLALTLRRDPSSTDTLAIGSLQGHCRLVGAEKPPADSTLNLEGEYLIRRHAGALQSPLWKSP